MKVFVTSLLIAVLSGCGPLDRTGGPSPELDQPRVLRKIARPGLQIISASEFVAIELDAGAISQGTAAASFGGCPDVKDVTELVNCLGSPGCGGLPDPAELAELSHRAHDVSWTSGMVGGQPVYVANDSLGTLIIADGHVNVPGLTYGVTSRVVPPGFSPPGATASTPSTVAQVMGSASAAAGLPCGGLLQAPCEPAICEGGGDVQRRFVQILHDIQNTDLRLRLCAPQCDDLCKLDPPQRDCSCAPICACPNDPSPSCSGGVP